MPAKLPASISFYIVAHADDWQLFMQPNINKDLLASHNKVVFIITTAGDAGAGESYWTAREEGMKSSIRYCLAPHNTISEKNGLTICNKHDIQYCSINNTASYFLRLPDGGLNGNGFSCNKNESLTKLQNGKISSIKAIDNSTTYDDWEDFCRTVEAIIRLEKIGLSSCIVNYLNPDNGKNPNDHPDHVATGQAIQNTEIIKSLKQVLFVGYSILKAVVRLTETDLFWKVGMFAAYEKAVFDLCGYSTLKEDVDLYKRWCLSNSNFDIIDPK